MRQTGPVTTPPAIPGAVPPAGWYPDPSHPSRERLWDGIGWTDQVRGLRGLTQPPPTGEPSRASAYRPRMVRREVVAPAATPVPSLTGHDTADGVPLASFGRRVAATIIDTVIVSFAVGVFLPFFITDAGARLEKGLRELYGILAAGGTGTMSTDLAHLQVILTYAVIGATIVYGLVSLGLFSRTLGQRLVGIAVCPADVGREKVGWQHALLRSLVWTLLSQGGGFLYIIHFMSISLALWHPRRQTLPDLLARTQVVRR